jgi:hypothetical protein
MSNPCSDVLFIYLKNQEKIYNPKQYWTLHHSWWAKSNLEQFLPIPTSECADEEDATKQAVEREALQEAVSGCVLRVEPRPVLQDCQVMFLEDGHPSAPHVQLQYKEDPASL